MKAISSVCIILAFCSVNTRSISQTTSPVSDLKIAPTLTEWKTQRESIHQTLVKLLGTIPEISMPNVKISSTEEKKGYTVETFEFDNGAGAIVPGYVITPKDGKRKHSAVYYCHWHGGNYDLGKQEIFTTHHTPEIPVERIIKEGYAVMAIDAYCFGERSGNGPGGKDEKGAAEEMSASKKELWMGRSLWAMMIRDDMMALNYLFSRSDIDDQNVAVTGMSMGATRTWWLMALDKRIKTGVAVGCLTRYQNLLNEQKLKYHGIYYFVPGVLTYFDSEAIISLIAPRPVLFMTGDQDAGSPISGILKIEAEVRKAYSLYDSSNNFENIVYPNVGHEYTPDMWKRMVDWMNANLH